MPRERERTRITLTPPALVLDCCKTEGRVCVFVAFLSTSYAHQLRIKKDLHDSSVSSLI